MHSDLDPPARLPAVVTDWPSRLQDIWRQLSYLRDERVPMTYGEIATIRPHLRSLLATARTELAKAPHKDFMAAIALVMTMPSQVISEELGDAAFMAYQIGCADLPADLLMKAATLALRDPKRVFRPSPPELRAYVITEFEERQARLDRLIDIEHMPPMKYVPPPAKPQVEAPPATGPDIAAMNEWGKPLGFQWDATGKMTRVEPQRDKARPLEEREAPTAHPQAADYAEIAAQILASAPPVSDVSPALKAMRDRMLAHNTAKGY